MQMPPLLRPLVITQLVNRGIGLYRAHFVPLVLMSTVELCLHPQ